MDLSVPDARSLSDEILEALRLRALRGCALGLCEADVAFLLGVSRETVSRWWSAYSTAGVDALPGQRTGQAVGVCEQIDRYTPEQLGIPSPLWNRRAVRALIDKEYGIRMPVRTVGEYLKRWGYTAKKPRRHARDQDSEEV